MTLFRRENTTYLVQSYPNPNIDVSVCVTSFPYIIWMTQWAANWWHSSPRHPNWWNSELKHYFFVNMILYDISDLSCNVVCCYFICSCCCLQRPIMVWNLGQEGAIKIVQYLISPLRVSSNFLFEVWGCEAADVGRWARQHHSLIAYSL